MDVEKNWATVKRGEVFRALHTRPENWLYFGHCIHRVGACQLCDTPIVWQYALVEKDGFGIATNRMLWVGDECITKHYQAWMPNGLQMALERMRKATKVVKQGLVAQRIEEFKKEGFGDVVDYLLGPERRGYRDQRIYCDAVALINSEAPDEQQYGVPVSKFRASIRRKGYLKTEELAFFLSGYNRSQWGKPYADSKMLKETQI